MIIEQPPIELLGIRINEPVTTITDLMVSVVCYYAFFKLNKIPVRNKVHLFIRYYFFTMGTATLVGGFIGHAFFYLFSMHWKLIGWLTSMISVALLERAAIEYAKPLIGKKVGKFFTWINLIELTTFVTITFSTLNFFFVEVHSAYGLLVVVSSFNLFVFFKRKTKGSILFLIAVGFSAIAALFFMNEWAIDKWFNHLDISHCFMTIAAFFTYRGSIAILKDPLLNS